MTLSRSIAIALIPAWVVISASASARPVVVELFTSQGCSSCPPAEALLNAYADRSDLLPLAFHVTYWDRLGWRDTFSFEGATQRQDSYSNQLGTGSFTPQMVIDGRYSAIGSRRDEVADAVRKAAPQTGEADVALRRDGDRIGVRVGSGRGSARILLIGFDRQHTTPIKRGENGGRTITQSNIVRSIRSVGTWNGSAVDLSETAPTGQDVAVILQAPGGGIVGAARVGGA